MTSRPTKAVILARGLGTRMREQSTTAVLDSTVAKAADAGVKGMIDVGRPFLDYLVSALADAGIREVCLVIGPEHELIREHFSQLQPSRVRIHYAIQAEPLGTADAVAAAANFASDERVLVLNSDNYYPPAALSALLDAPGSALLGFDRAALLADSNIPADRIAAFAIVDHTSDFQLRRIIEKPDPETIAEFGSKAPISMNAWVFTPQIYPACRNVVPSVRGELELVSAVSDLLSAGEVFTVVPVAVGCLDMSRRDDIGAVRDRLAGIEVVL